MKVSIIVISKDEPQLADTLAGLQGHLNVLSTMNPSLSVEVLVVDASEGRLEDVHKDNPWLDWIDFRAPKGVRVSIPHQRNAGVETSTGDIVVFTDSGCTPQEDWLVRLIFPIINGMEQVTCGPSWVGDNVYSAERGVTPPYYVTEAPTINLALRREVFDVVGHFDEAFEYGSDVDFTWRVVDAGIKIRYVADAVVIHDWGTFRRQVKRSVRYGAARARLYGKHRGRIPRILRDDPVPVVYPVYLLGLPLAIRHRWYLLLAFVPLWRARRRPFPLQVAICHFAEGVGSLQEVGRMLRDGAREPGR